jgi:hypothetical protein
MQAQSSLKCKLFERFDVGRCAVVNQTSQYRLINRRLPSSFGHLQKTLVSILYQSYQEIVKGGNRAEASEVQHVQALQTIGNPYEMSVLEHLLGC